MAAVALVRWCRRRGVDRAAVSDKLGVQPATLQSWEQRWSDDRMELAARGRPVERAGRELRGTLLSLFALMGPALGVPTLRELFPDVARGELEELARRCRKILRRGKTFLVHQLRWTRVGSVWAMDFTTPPAPIDGHYTRIFCVRDLASGQQLLALPCIDERAETAIAALRSLVRWYGAPLVLKCDNGSHFKAWETKQWAREAGILLLFSPASYPQYNGAIEAGQGSLQTRAHWEAARNGRPGHWTCDDIEAARVQANRTGQPRGPAGPSPHASWIWRQPIPSPERDLFLDRYREYHRLESSARGVLDHTMLQHNEQSQIDRVAISRALIDNGFLLIRRKRLSLPISKARVGFIS